MTLRNRLLGFALVCCGASAYAERMADPMQPPLYEVPVASGAQARGPVLQSIVIGKDRRYAMINGERVPVGGAYGDAKVVRIVENEVTLRDAAGGDTVLKLVPEIKKRVVTPKVAEYDKGRKGKQ